MASGVWDVVASWMSTVHSVPYTGLLSSLTVSGQHGIEQRIDLVHLHFTFSHLADGLIQSDLQ